MIRNKRILLCIKAIKK